MNFGAGKRRRLVERGSARGKRGSRCLLSGKFNQGKRYYGCVYGFYGRSQVVLVVAAGIGCLCFLDPRKFPIGMPVSILVQVDSPAGKLKSRQIEEHYCLLPPSILFRLLCLRNSNCVFVAINCSNSITI